MPATDVDMLHGNGKVVSEVLKQADVRSTLFTGSHGVAELLAKDLKGKVWRGTYLWGWSVGPSRTSLRFQLHLAAACPWAAALYESCFEALCECLALRAPEGAPGLPAALLCLHGLLLGGSL